MTNFLTLLQYSGGIIAILGLIYNTIVTHIVLKNDLKHQTETNSAEHADIKERLTNIESRLFELAKEK